MSFTSNDENVVVNVCGVYVYNMKSVNFEIKCRCIQMKPFEKLKTFQSTYSCYLYVMYIKLNPKLNVKSHSHFTHCCLWN